MLSCDFSNCALWSSKVSPAPLHSPGGLFPHGILWEQCPCTVCEWLRDGYSHLHFVPTNSALISFVFWASEKILLEERALLLERKHSKPQYLIMYQLRPGELSDLCVVLQRKKGKVGAWIRALDPNPALWPLPWAACLEMCSVRCCSGKRNGVVYWKRPCEMQV